MGVRFSSVTLQGRSRASQAMDAYADGDDSAFCIIYDELAPRLSSYVRRIRHDKAGTDDLLQQIFLSMHQARGSFVRGARVEPWAYAIARHTVIDMSRQNARRNHLARGECVLPADANFTPEASARTSELEQALRGRLHSVPEKLREAFLLVRVEGLSTAEAAQVLGSTALAVKLRAHRAAVMLRRDLVHLGFGRDAR